MYGQLKLVKEKGLWFVFRFKSRIVPQLPWQGVPCCFTFAVKTPLTRGTLVHGSDSYSLPPDTECTDLPVVIYKIKRNIYYTSVITKLRGPTLTRIILSTPSSIALTSSYLRARSYIAILTRELTGCIVIHCIVMHCCIPRTYGSCTTGW